MKFDSDQIARIYKSVFETENGKIILEDLEKEVLHRNPFASENLEHDCMLREGARLLLEHIHAVISMNDSFNNENGGSDND
jgi:hypothetical protein